MWPLLLLIPLSFPSLTAFQARFGVLEKHDQVRVLQQNLGPHQGGRGQHEDVAQGYLDSSS